MKSPENPCDSPFFKTPASVLYTSFLEGSLAAIPF